MDQQIQPKNESIAPTQLGMERPQHETAEPPASTSRTGDPRESDASKVREDLQALMLERQGRQPEVRPETGHEGTPMLSMPGHKMTFNEQAGMAGVEIEAPDGRLITFGGKPGLERFIEENNISDLDGAALRAIDARADPFRTAGPQADRDSQEAIDLQAAIDRKALHEIEARGELRITDQLTANDDRDIAVDDAAAFRQIQNRDLKEHAAVQIADNARDSAAYKTAHTDSGIADEVAAFDALHTTKMLEKEDRKSAAFDAMLADREERARNWTPEEAQEQAKRDTHDYRQETSNGERVYKRSDMALNGDANPHYKAALQTEAPDVAQEVAAETAWKSRSVTVKESRKAAEETGLNGIEPAIERRQPQQLDADSEEKRSTWLKKAEGEQAKPEQIREARDNRVESDEIFTATKADIKPVIPPDVERQYLRVGDKFYHPKNPEAVVFEDKGNKLETKSSSEAVAESLVRIAEARGWDEIKVSGSEAFRKEAWLEAASRGMHVKGYSPSEQDKADLAKRDSSRQANKVEKEPTRTQHSEETKTPQGEHGKPAAANKRAADSFVNDPPQEAVKKHPELAGALAIASAIDKKVEADGLNEHQRTIVMARVRQNVVNSIERGELPEVKVKESVEVKRDRNEEKEFSR